MLGVTAGDGAAVGKGSQPAPPVVDTTTVPEHVAELQAQHASW